MGSEANPITQDEGVNAFIATYKQEKSETRNENGNLAFVNYCTLVGSPLIAKDNADLES